MQSVYVHRAVVVMPTLAPVLLKCLALARVQARADGGGLAPELVEFEANLRSVVGTVVAVDEPEPVAVWISTTEAGRRLGLGRARVCQMIRSGLLAPARRAGRGWIVDEQAVAEEASARETEVAEFRQIGVPA